MRFATYTADGKTFYGVVTDNGMIALSPEFPQWPTLYDVVAGLGLSALAEASKGKPVTHTDFDYAMVMPNAPRILCVGVNFPDRNAEYKDGSAQPKYMSLFPRFASGFTGHDLPLIRPPENHTLDYEGEVAVVIGKEGRRISQDDAYDHIAALTLCNEGTIRDWVRHAKFNVTQGKNWDKSGAMGPWLVPFTDAKQLDDARITTRVNGEIRQDDVLSRMMFPIHREIEYISIFMTLKPGDIIVTGTPTGAGARFDPPRYLKPGDVVEIEVEGIGTLRNGVEDETWTPDDYAKAAADLLCAEETHEQIDLLSLRHPEMNIGDAYEIQNALYRAKLAQGRRVIGWKIGLTSKAMQYALNIDIPDSGMLFDDMRFDNGGTVPKGRFIQPRIEAEIVFVMKAPLAGENVSRVDVLAATDYVTPGIEILDTRILRKDPETGTTRKIVDTIADNAANAGVVLGDAGHAVNAHDLRWVGAIVSRDNDVEETGLGAGVLNDPVESVVWLARRMAEYGQRIESGQIILSGSFVRPVECPSDTSISADFGEFGRVDISFE